MAGFRLPWRGKDDGRAGSPVPEGMAALSGASTHASDRVLSLLREGKTVHQVAMQTGTSEVFVKVMLEHFERIGMARSAASLCSSGLGACSSSGEALSMQAQIACAGCPLKLPKNLG
ncbi:hypothetical protein JOD55_000005 [Arcanobacterium pluranimalium]|uniref:hypothetical protein n=1 Tax=Arcanobacterium pluranimalium TaxID=108028 RepID=UPI00195A773A|nr:hypothetical protein [Arcanobacterium pluranimalium]MBM7824178.1 hypothetical protein [Arcanobacterium pluranimalium]